MLEKLKVFITGMVKDKEEIKNKRTTKKDETRNIRIVKECVTREERESGIKIKEIESLFPLNQGDIFQFKSGKKYKVCKKTMQGIIDSCLITLKWINKEEYSDKNNPVEMMKFTSLRELNYHVFYQRHLIVKIIKNPYIEKTKQLNIDECHCLAIEENQKRDKINKFFSHRKNKKT